MIRRFIFGLLLAGLFASAGNPQVGPLPGMVVLPPPMAAAAICTGSPVATNLGTNSNLSATGTVSLTGVTVPTGSLIVVTVLEAQTASSVSGSGTVADGINSYSSVVSTLLDNTNTAVLRMFYAANASLSSGTITYTGSVGNSTDFISVATVSNILASSPLDSSVTATAFGNSTTPSVTSGAASISGEMFIGALGYLNGTATFTQDSGHGWAAPPNPVTFFIGAGSQINSGTAAKTYSPTLSAAVNWADAVLGFQHC